MRFFLALWVCNILHVNCFAQLSIRDEILKEKSEWIQPGRDRRFEKTKDVANVLQPLCGQPADVGDLQKTLQKTEKLLSQCEAKLVKLQLAADLSENGKLDANSVYVKKLVVAVLNRIDGGFSARKGAQAQLQLFLSDEEKIEMRDRVTTLDQSSVAQLVEKMQDIINKAHVTYGHVEKHSHFRQLYIDICAILGEMDLFAAIQLSIVVSAIAFVYIAVTRQSKLVKLSSLLVFGMWISYFWHWQNMLRGSQANRHILSQKNPCEDSRSFYNPLRFFGSDSKECEEFLRKMFTPMFWEFTPLDVLCNMVSTYASNLLSVLIVNLLGAIGDAIREFADKQSWFSMLPAFAILLMVLFIFVFKLSGLGASLFYGALRIGPTSEVPPVQRLRSPTYDDSYGRLNPHRCSSPDELCWAQDHSNRTKKKRHRHASRLDSDSDTYLTAGE